MEKIMSTTYNIVVCFQYIHRYLIQCARHVSGITFIKGAQIKKSNNIKVFRSNKTKRNRQDRQLKSNDYIQVSNGIDRNNWY
jgi:hypothetical protein